MTSSETQLIDKILRLFFLDMRQNTLRQGQKSQESDQNLFLYYKYIDMGLVLSLRRTFPTFTILRLAFVC